MTKTSPTQRSLALLRKDGYTAAIVEHWNAYAHIRQDLFNCIDIVAINADIPGVTGIQTTSRANFNARIQKSTAIPALKVWLQAGNKFIVHGWSKKGARGKVKHWVCDQKEITLAQLNGGESGGSSEKEVDGE